MRVWILILTLGLFSAAGSVRAQSLEAFKEQLARPSVAAGAAAPACVVAQEFDDAAEAVARAARSEHRPSVKGFRVCIFSDNGLDARVRAEAALSLFAETYPGIRGYKTYDTPYFRVTVGNCLTAEEAIILKGKISETFPKAFPKSEELTLQDFLN